MSTNKVNPVALVTGGAKRIGAEICKVLHENHYDIVLHYRNSKPEALQLCASLNALRANSCVTLQAELDHALELKRLAESAINTWGHLDVLVNNASAFYPTPLLSTRESDWDSLMNSNLKAPYFLTTYLAEELKKQQGCVINIVDIYSKYPLKEHPVYSVTKAGLQAMTKCLALELGPDGVRVNGISPGAILWPDANDEKRQQQIIQRTCLKRTGGVMDIAQTVIFLVKNAPFITGQIVAVDGGRLNG